MVKIKSVKKLSLILTFFVITTFGFANRGYKAFLLGDMEGNIHVEENIYDVRPIASITKMMTVLVTLDYMKENNLSLDDTLIISPKTSKIPYGTKMISGKQYTVRDVMKATIIASSNSAAHALSEYVAGDSDLFVKMMNKKAIDLGLTSLRYCTPHGLPPGNTGGKCMDQGNAADLYKLAQVVVTYPEYMEIAKNTIDYIDNGRVAVKTTNNLLRRLDYVDGLKTGYHKAAGSNIVTTAIKDDQRIFIVVLGANKSKIRDDLGEQQITAFYDGKKEPSLPEQEKITKNVIYAHEVTVDHSLPKVVIADEEEAIAHVNIDDEEYGIYPLVTVADNDITDNENKNISLNLTKKLETTTINEVVGEYEIEIDGKIYRGDVILKK